MPERKVAVINVNKGLLSVTLVTFTTFVSDIGNPFVASTAAIRQVVSASGILKPLLEKMQEEHFE